MIWVPARTKLHDVVATIQIAQAAKVRVAAADIDALTLLALAGVSGGQHPEDNPVVLPYTKAFVKASRSAEPYCCILATEAGYNTIQLDDPKLVVQSIAPKKIIMAPFPIASGLGFEDTRPWAFVHNHLKTYEPDVLLLSEHNEWMDNCAIPECDILSEVPIETKLEYLAAARIVVGVPNAWTWIAAGLGVPTVVCYPDRVPVQRWFPFTGKHIAQALIEYPTRIPTLLAGLRQLIAALGAA